MFWRHLSNRSRQRRVSSMCSMNSVPPSTNGIPQNGQQSGFSHEGDWRDRCVYSVIYEDDGPEYEHTCQLTRGEIERTDLGHASQLAQPICDKLAENTNTAPPSQVLLPHPFLDSAHLLPRYHVLADDGRTESASSDPPTRLLIHVSNEPTCPAGKCGVVEPPTSDPLAVARRHLTKTD